MGMSRGTAEYIAYKAHVECLGRQPTKEDLKLRADQIIAKGEGGPLFVYATLYESKEGADFRKRRGW